MSATTLSVSEVVEDWPPAPSGLSARAAAIPPAVIWSRIEGWISHRFSPRPAVFLVEGPGSWSPPLVPFSGISAEIWLPSDSWSSVLLRAAPIGYCLDEFGPYRITGIAGSDDDDPPAAVFESYRRLAEYSGHRERHPGESAWDEAIGELKDTATRAPTWLARALSLSGAADLLRPWRAP